MKPEQTLYVACALNSASDEYIKQVEQVKHTLEIIGFNVLHFVGKGNHEPFVIYERDIIDCVNTCSAFLGIYGGTDSDGRGYETARAIDRNIPMVGVAEKGERVSKLILGAYEYHHKPFVFVDNLLLNAPKITLQNLGLPLGML